MEGREEASERLGSAFVGRRMEGGEDGEDVGGGGY